MIMGENVTNYGGWVYGDCRGKLFFEVVEAAFVGG